MRAYGVIPGEIQWGQFNIHLSMSYHSMPDFELGYQFVKNGKGGGSYYFTVTQERAQDDSPANKNGAGVPPQNALVMFYFTRAQALALADLFSQSQIDSAMDTAGIDYAKPYTDVQPADTLNSSTSAASSGMKINTQPPASKPAKKPKHSAQTQDADKY
jgi:hypothetical protein